jgi:hypothetical protein
MEMNKSAIAATEKYPVVSIISAWFFVMTVTCKSPENRGRTTARRVREQPTVGRVHEFSVSGGYLS